MTFPAKIIESRFEDETLNEKSRFIRFEKLSEQFTYVILIAGIFLTLLPFKYSFDRISLYIFILSVLCLSFVWFRFLPKKYSGRTKNLVYYSLSVAFVGFVVYFTGGIQSPAVFLFYLTCLAVAASMTFRETILFTTLSVVIIFLQIPLAGQGLGLPQSFSLAILHIWGLGATVLFGWFLFTEERKFREAHNVAHLKRVAEINQIKDEFVFIISSKLANPIITLKEFINIVLSERFGKLSSDQKDILTKTEENSRRLELLVGDMLDLSKIESGALRLDKEKVEVNKLLSSTLSDFALKASDKKISLLFDKPRDQIFVLADSARLHEVVANLVDNAIKYSSNGARVKIRSEKKGGFAQISVEDNGPGISKKSQEHLFEKFYRADKEKSKIKGSGLGLFISKQLIEKQGGSIWCDSEPGEGTTFSFKIPIYGNR